MPDADGRNCDSSSFATWTGPLVVEDELSSTTTTSELRPAWGRVWTVGLMLLLK